MVNLLLGHCMVQHRIRHENQLKKRMGVIRSRGIGLVYCPVATPKVPYAWMLFWFCTESDSYATKQRLAVCVSLKVQLSN